MAADSSRAVCTPTLALLAPPGAHLAVARGLEHHGLGLQPSQVLPRLLRLAGQPLRLLGVSPDAKVVGQAKGGSESAAGLLAPSAAEGNLIPLPSARDSLDGRVLRFQLPRHVVLDQGQLERRVLAADRGGEARALSRQGGRPWLRSTPSKAAAEGQEQWQEASSASCQFLA